jgi:hypothetical protein
MLRSIRTRDRPNPSQSEPMTVPSHDKEQQMSVRRSVLAATAAGAITVGSLVALPAFAQGTAPGPLGPLVAIGERTERPLLEWRRQHRAERAEALAAELGISVDELRAAARAAHEAVVAELGPIDLDNPPEGEAFDARRDAFRAALASELGVTVDDLHAAALAVFEQSWD